MDMPGLSVKELTIRNSGNPVDYQADLIALNEAVAQGWQIRGYVMSSNTAGHRVVLLQRT